MDAINLREAARRSGRSVTTLRRHIRRGKLTAEKRPGRFGPEFFVTEQALEAAGFPLVSALAAVEPPAIARRPPHADESSPVPLVLYQELQMKHEQLLVQYGMMRAGGLRAVELRAELDEMRRRLEEAQARTAELRRRLADETARMGRGLRRAELERESHQIEAEALRERLRALEMLHRNAATNETIERQFAEIMAQSRKILELDADARSPAPRKPDVDH